MSPDRIKGAKDSPEHGEELSSTDLQDLEQHITQRISQLSDGSLPAEGNLLYEMDAAELASSTDTSLVPPFDPFEVRELPGLHNLSPTMHPAFSDFKSNYNPSQEVIQNLHDLHDLVTDAIRQIKIRLTSLEERVAILSDSKDEELQKCIKEIKTVSKESQAALKAASGAASGARSVTDSATANILADMQKELLALEDRIERGTQDLRQRLDEKSQSVREHLDTKMPATQTMPTEHRDYFNRYFFNLSILIIILLFIAGALITNTIDRMTSYLTQSIDALRASVDQITLPEQPVKGRGGQERGR